MIIDEKGEVLSYLYILLTKKGNKTIKSISDSGQEKIEKADKVKFLKEKIKAFSSAYRDKEKKIIYYIKNNRTRIFLDFFRKNSAVIVVALTTSLVAVGNVNSKKDSSGFLFGYFDKPVDVKAQIEQRVKSHSSKNNLTMVPLAAANSTEDEGDIRELMIKDGNLNQNQMQYQVMTATTAPDAKDLLQEGADVAVYEVKDGDTVSSIANDFKVTTKTILWANDIDNPNMIQPGDKIFILPVTGVKHVVKSGDTIDKISSKYKADKERIISFNELPADGSLKEGDELVIPDGQIEDAPAASPDSLLQKRNYYSSDIANTTPGVPERMPSIIDKNPKGGHAFPYGYCTWYVASKKYVPWGGNAGTWLYHAKAYGASTGKSPKAGAIIVTNESWYGHVGIVEKISGSEITISEMNYVGWGKKSTRTISTSSRVIKGYIY